MAGLHNFKRLSRRFIYFKWRSNRGLTNVRASSSIWGIMIGRAWHEPYRIGEISQLLWPQVEHLSVDELIQAVYNYAIKQIQQDIPLRFVFRPLLGLFNGQKAPGYGDALYLMHNSLKRRSCIVASDVRYL